MPERKTTLIALLLIALAGCDAGAEGRRAYREGRFEEAHGRARLVQTEPHEALRHFVEMHRSASGPKGSFMTPELQRFFGALLDLPESAIHLLYNSFL